MGVAIGGKCLPPVFNGGAPGAGTVWHLARPPHFRLTVNPTGAAGTRCPGSRMLDSDTTVVDLDGIHVLIVEDTAESLEVLRVALQCCGALATSVATAREAEHLLRELRPHVLITDINKPDDGVALLGMAGTILVATIAITAACGRRADLEAEGFVEVVESPLDALEVCRTIRQHLLIPASEAADSD